MPIPRPRSAAATAALVAALAIALTSCTAPQSVQRSSPRPSVSASPAPSLLPEFGAPSTAALPPARARALQKVLADALAQGYPDAFATVMTPAGTWSGAAGVDGPKGRRAGEDDVLAIASISKTITAALVFKLAEEGRMRLDAPLASYLDGPAARATNGATVRQALAMRAGLPDTADDVRTAALADPRHVTTRAEVVAAFPEAEAKPGESADYSNPTYKLLGFAAERAGGAPLAQLIRAEVVEPAQVPGTLVVQSPEVATPGPWALPITGDRPWGAGGTLPFVADSTFSAGASGMAGDTRSVAAWAWHLFAGDVVSRASLAAMASTDFSGIASGLDPYAAPLPEGSVGHGGGKEGYESLLVIVPKAQAVVMVAVNQQDATLDLLAADLLAAAA